MTTLNVDWVKLRFVIIEKICECLTSRQLLKKIFNWLQFLKNKIESIDLMKPSSRWRFSPINFHMKLDKYFKNFWYADFAVLHENNFQVTSTFTFSSHISIWHNYGASLGLIAREINVSNLINM